MRLTPKAIKLRRAARAAREQFLAQGVHNTSDRCGVLIYVSVAEHYVELLADRAIDAKVAPEAWDVIVAAFVTTVKPPRVAEGLEQAVDGCGLWWVHPFPPPP